MVSRKPDPFFIWSEDSMKQRMKCLYLAVCLLWICATPGYAADASVFSDVSPKSPFYDAIGWAVRAAELGAGEILLTSMDRDGSKLGFDVELTRRIAEALWTGDRRPGFADFRARMETHRKRLLSQGVNCAPLE